MGRGLVVLASLGIATYLFSVGINFPGNYEGVLLDWVCFFGLVLCSYHAFGDYNSVLPLLSKYNAIATLFVVAYGLLQAIGLEPFPLLRSNEFPSSFFGFQNMTAEFIGISIVIQAIDLKYYGGRRIWRWMLLGASTYYVLLLACRSIFVALPIALILVFFRKRKVFKLALIFSATIPLLLSVLLYSRVSVIASPELQTAKSNNMRARMVRWINTLYLIKDNLMGIGPGNYEFGYVPYQRTYARDVDSREDSLVRSPHNGFLEAAAENGLPFAIILLVLLSWMLRSLFMAQSKSEGEGAIIDTVISLLVFIMIDAFFSFPMENAYPFYVVSLCIGLFLRITATHSHIAIGRYRPIVAVLVIIVLAGQAFASVFSNYLYQNHQGNYARLVLACNLFQPNWRACIKKAEAELSLGHPLDAERTLGTVLKRNRDNYLAIKMLGLVYLATSRIPQACEQFDRYKTLFSRDSSIRDELIRHCER